MRVRILIATIFILMAIALLHIVYNYDLTTTTSGIFVNLGTGFVGTSLTVLIVDWLYARRTSQETCRKIALTTLQSLDHAVWVWQGDSREFSINELYSRINDADRLDPFPSYTQDLFIHLGDTCATYINLNRHELKLTPKLLHTLSELKKLQSIRDFERNYEFIDFIKLLSLSVEELSGICNLAKPTLIPLPISAHRITSEEHQHYRLYGKQLDGSHQPIWH